jgi:hypothetical protein
MKKINNIYLMLVVLVLQSVSVHAAALAEDREAKELRANTPPPNYEQAVRKRTGHGWSPVEWDVMRHILSRPDLPVTFTAAYANLAQNKEKIGQAATNKLRNYIEFALIQYLANIYFRAINIIQPCNAQKITADFAVRYLARENMIVDKKGATAVRLIAQAYDMEPADPGLAAHLYQIANETQHEIETQLTIMETHLQE